MEVAARACDVPRAGVMMMRPESLFRESSLGYQVNHLARLMAQALRHRIEPMGVVPGQFAQLLALYESDGITQTELCARVRIEQPTMANTLNRMERDGLITRVPDPSDRRRTLVKLTGHAWELEGEVIAAARAVNTIATGGLDEHETTAFMATMGKVIDNLEGTGGGRSQDHNEDGAST